jgi:capsular polysaccharide biosynthesis protein
MTFAQYLDVLRRSWVFVGICAVIGAITVASALSLTSAHYQGQFSLAIGPGDQPVSAYSTLLEALDKRSVPSTLAQIATSDTAKHTAAIGSDVTANTMTVHAVVVLDSNVVAVTVNGTNATNVRKFALALQTATSASFENLYTLYEIRPLRTATTTTPVPRHVSSGALLGLIIGALIGYLLALARHNIKTTNSNQVVAAQTISEDRALAGPGF